MTLMPEMLQMLMLADPVSSKVRNVVVIVVFVVKKDVSCSVVW